MRPLLGKTLEDLRKAHGLKQYQMANIANVCRSTYGGWEKDKGCPSFIQVYLLTARLHDSFDRIVFEFKKNQRPRSGK